MSKHPTYEGREISDALTMGYVREHFVPKDEHLKRINAKTAQLDEARSRMMEIEQQLGELRGASDSLAELRGELRRRDDLDAFRRAGLGNSDGDIDEGLIDLFRYAHGKSIGEEDEIDDRDQHFRDWLNDPEGAATHPALGHHLRKTEAAPMAAPKPKPAPTRAPPTGNAGTIASDPGNMTPQQLREYTNSAAYRSLPKDRKLEILAQFSGR